MNRTRKLVLVAIAVATATISALRAGSTLQGEETITASSDPARFSLTVENGTPNGNYEAGTLVIVSADAPQAGAHFAGWTGDVAILANPFIPTTTATIPYMAVTIAATYTEPAVNPFLILDAILDCLWGG
jgi:hypothetical protein